MKDPYNTGLPHKSIYVDISLHDLVELIKTMEGANRARLAVAFATVIAINTRARGDTFDIGVFVALCDVSE